VEWRAWLSWAGPVLELVVLVGLFARGRVRRAWMLPVLMFALLVSDGAALLFAWANTWLFWFAKELVHAFLFLCLGIEVTLRVFASLPGAWRKLKAWVSVVALTAIVLAATLPVGTRALTAVPRLLLAVALLYGGVYSIMLWHMLPVDSLHKAVLLGFAPYLLFSAVSWGRVESRWEYGLANVASPLLFVLVLLALASAAWHRDPIPDTEPGLVRRLWPWR
jgi:hypothetical protein